MSTKAFIRAGLSLIVVVAAACTDTLAPKLERIQSQIANAVTCDVNWTGSAGDDMWQSPGNWAPPAVPTASQNACITGDGSYVELYGDATVRSLTIGTPGNAIPTRLAVRGLRVGTGYYNLPANLNVANGIENFGTISIDATGFGPGAVTINVTGGVLQNNGRVVALSKDFGVNGGDLVHYVNANVVNDGLMDFYSSVEMTGTWTNRGAVKLKQAANAFDMPYFYNLTGGTWDQVSGSLEVQGTFEVRDGLVRLLSGEIIGSEGPIVLRGGIAIADNANFLTGNVTLRQNVAMSGNIPAGLTVIAAGHAYSTTGFFIPTNVTAANGLTNRGTLRLISTGHAGGTPVVFNVTNGAIDNYGRIESYVGGGDKGRVVNSGIVNRAGALVEIKTTTDFNKPGATYENLGRITVAPSTFVTLNGAPSFVQNGTLTLGTDAQWKQDGGSFRLAGGAITGRPWLAGIALDIPAGSPGTGTLLLTHTNTIAGDVPAGVKLHVEQWRPGSTGFSFDGILNAAASFTNLGTIVLGNPGFNPNQAKVALLNGSTLTNRGRFETVADPAGGHRYVVGNFTNEGTLQLDNWTEFSGGTVRSLAPAAVTIGSVGGGLFDLMPGATLHASGTWALQLVNRGNLFIGASGTAAALSLREYSGVSGSAVTVDIGGSPAAPGTDFDRMSMTGPMTVGNGTMHVRAVNGACVDGGKAYDVIAFSHPSGDFAGYTGLDLGGGRAVQPQQFSNGYRLNVIGPVCVPPDVTPPVIAPTVTGTLGNNGWYTSDVSVTWSVTDAESAITSKTGCDDAAVTSDNAGVTFTCSATSAGGSASQSVTIKRDATPPVITTNASPAPNANGWNNTNVTASWSGTDAMSGLVGQANRQSVFNGEGLRMNFGARYEDNAGNKVEVLIYASIDRTPPVVSATRAPAANANGWNNSDVTATYSATDGLSGLDGAASATELFANEAAGQSGSHVFTDLAGNSATASISGISIDKTAPVVNITRSPNSAWSSIPVIVIWVASDALSGIDGNTVQSHTFTEDGANQSATRSFTDKAGNVTSATITGVNIDKTPEPPPPTVLLPACNVTPNEIWPPNNKMVAVRATVGGTGVTSFKLKSVTNNETGSADVEGWTIGTADVDGSVKATRLGGGSGRTYTLTYDVFGANGATGSCAVIVRVPHDQRK